MFKKDNNNYAQFFFVGMQNNWLKTTVGNCISEKNRNISYLYNYIFQKEIILLLMIIV